MTGGFNPFGSWEEFSSIVNRAGFAFKNLVGQDRLEPWTPGLRFGGATTGITYQIQRGRFYVIGRLVYASYRIVLSSKGTATGSAVLTGLPLKTSPLNDPAIETSSAVGVWVNMGSNLVHMSLLPDPDATTAVIGGLTAAGSSVGALDDTNFADTSQLYGHLIYGRA